MISSEQSYQISQFVVKGGIRHYDLEAEIVDHISEWIKRDMANNNSTFETSFSRLPQYFSPSELHIIQKSRKKYLSKKYFSIFLIEWKSFFTWPKMILQLLFWALSILFFSIGKEKGWIGHYLIQIQFLIIIGAGFLYRFREMYKLNHETDMIKKLLPFDIVSRIGLLLRLPAFLSFILLIVIQIFLGELPLAFYEILVYSYPIQIPFFWAVYKMEADIRLRLRKDYPEAFQSA